ncbi:MAG TPA: hypothetical protein VFF48_10315 [Brevundimonas sp.]|nr:hypothetical protein [Brevundimonas sp.]
MSLAAALLAIAALIGPSQAPSAPCRTVDPASAPVGVEFRNAVAVGDFAMVTLTGDSTCDLNRRGEGRCVVRDPRVIKITMAGRHAWFEVAQGRAAQIKVENGAATCSVVREIGKD